MDAIRDALDKYYNAWNEAFKSKSDVQVRAWLSAQFTGYWSKSEMDKPEQYDFNYNIIEVLNLYVDAEKSFEATSISERKDGDEAIVAGTETNRIGGKRHQAKCMFVWRKENREWKLLREYIELER